MPKVKPIRASIPQPEVYEDEETHSTIVEIISQSKRDIIAFVANLFVAGTTMYVGAMVTETLTIAAVMLTGSAFVAFMIAFIGFSLSIMASVAAGAFVAKYIANGTALEDMARCKKFLSAKFEMLRAKVVAP